MPNILEGACKTQVPQAHADADGRLFQRLAAEAEAYAARIGGGVEVAGYHQIGALYNAYRGLSAELAGYTGKCDKPQNGCAFFTAIAGDASVLLEYEYEPGEAAQTSGPPEKCYEGCAASVSIIQALVNGAWCSPEDVFAATLLDRWAEQIAESEDQIAIDQRESFERDRYDDERDFAHAQEERAGLRGGAYAAVLREAT